MKSLFFSLSFSCLIAGNLYAQNYLWTKTAGGNLADYSWNVAFDSQGNVITVGEFTGTVDLDPGAGTDIHIEPPGGYGNDIFVQKLDANGNLLWAGSFGGTDEDIPTRVLVDVYDNIIITGTFRLTVDFDPGTGTHNVTAGNWGDTFILKLDSQGNFIWVKNMTGSPAFIRISGCCFDTQGNICTTGYFSNTVDFDPGPGTSMMTTNAASGRIAGFVQKLDAQGNFVWAKAFNISFISGLVWSFCDPVHLDADDNNDLYITGRFQDTVDFDPGPGVFKLYGTDAWDGFVTKLHSDGSFVWAREINGAGDQYAFSISLDAMGCYVGGKYEGSTDADPGPGVHTLPTPTGTGSDAFLLKLDLQGSFQWVITHTTPGSDDCLSITNDPMGNVYMGGSFSGVCDVDPSAAVNNLISNGSTDASLCCYSPNGNLLWARKYGGSTQDKLSEIKLDYTGNIYVTGYFSGSADFNFDAGTDNHTSNGSSDIYTMKLSVPTLWSIDEPQENLINVFPNPVQSVLQISSSSNEKGILEIFGADGKLIVSEPNFSPSVTKDFNVSFLPNGMYIIHLTQEAKVSSCRFIKN